MKFWFLAACCAVSAAAARPTATFTGTVPAQSINRIAAAGDLTVRGKKSNVIRYTLSPAGTGIEVNGGVLVFPEGVSVRLEVPRGIRVLSLSSDAGFVDAADLDGSVIAATSAGRITLDRIGGDAEVRSGGGATLLGTIGGAVRCYSRGGSIRAVRVNGDALFETGGGDVQLGDLQRSVRVLTGAGGIHIDQARGQVIAETYGGPISVLRAFGMVIANSGGGPIDIGAAKSVRCQSASGSIRLSNVSGSLRATTERGSIVVDIVRGQPLEESFLSTLDGDITVSVPSNTGVSIEAEALGTRDERVISSDFGDLRFEPRRTSVWGKSETNGGGPALRLLGAGGRIQVKRK